MDAAALEQGIDYEARGQGERAEERFGAAIAAAVARRDREAELAARFHLVRLLVARPGRDLPSARKHLAAARRLVARGAVADSHDLHRPGRISADALAALEARRRAAEGDARGAAVAAEALIRRLARPGRAADLSVAGEAYWALALARLEQGRSEEGIRLLGEAAACLDRSGDDRARLGVLTDIGRALVGAGQFRDALPFLRSAYDDAAPMRDAGVRGRAAVALARALTPLGRFAEARALLEDLEPDDPDVHRLAALVGALLDLEEGLESVRVADLRKYEPRDDLREALGRIRRAEDRLLRILAAEPPPADAAAARFGIALAAWAFASREPSPVARERCARLARQAADLCEEHARGPLAERAAHLVAEVRQDAPPEGATAAVLSEARRRVRARFEEQRRLVDLEEACRQQQVLLGVRGEVPPWAQVAARLVPVAEAFGDLWVAHASGDVVDLLVGDATGHGPDSVVLMSPVALALRERFAQGIADVEVEVDRLDRWIEGLGFASRFVALGWVRLDRRAGVARILRSADVRAYVRRGGWSSLPARWGPLGVGTQLRGRAFEVPLRPGLAVAFATDGIADRRDPEGRDFKESLLLAALRALPAAATATAVVDAVHAAAEAHADGAPAGDDQTVGAIRYLG